MKNEDNKRSNSTIIEPGERLLTRGEKRNKLFAIYDKALKTINDNLGVDKDNVYGGCTALTTVSRELMVLEKIMALNGESDSKKQAFWHNWGPHEKRQTETEA